MTVPQVVGTWMQIGGVLIAFSGLVITYRRYASKGTLKRVGRDIRRRAAWLIHPSRKRSPRLQFAGMGAWGAQVDTRGYDLPADTRQALNLLASFIAEDRALLLKTKAEAGHALHALEGTDTRQSEAVEAGVRDYALSGLALTAAGLVVTALGLVLTLF